MKNYQILKLPTIALGAVVGGFASFYYYFYFQNEMMTAVFGESWHFSDMLVYTCQPMIFVFMVFVGAITGIRVSEFVFSRASKETGMGWLSNGTLFFTALGVVVGGWFGRPPILNGIFGFLNGDVLIGAYIGAFVLLVVASTIANSRNDYYEEIELAQ
jgi:uncharacterized membrane protein YeaQ/YmgE (transglycosylase-associated protein family)